MGVVQRSARPGQCSRGVSDATIIGAVDDRDRRIRAGALAGHYGTCLMSTEPGSAAANGGELLVSIHAFRFQIEQPLPDRIVIRQASLYLLGDCVNVLKTSLDRV